MEKPACVILAGGQARRMGGGDKALLTLAGRPLLSYVVDALRPQAGALAINAGGDPARFAAWDLPVIADTYPGEGPLAGILAALHWAKHWTNGPVLTAPADTPFLPATLAVRLASTLEREGAEVAVAARVGALQPVIALWQPHVAAALERSLSGPGPRSVERFFRTRKWAAADFSDGPDPFLNINTPDDLATAERTLTSG